MKRLMMIAAAFLLMGSSAAMSAVPDKVMPNVAKEKGCLSCHEGVERFSEGDMQKDIEKFGAQYGDKDGCTVCHGGNNMGLTKEEAHAGAPSMLTSKGGPDNFYPDPGSLWISDRACGQCHTGYKDRLEKALMNTEAGKIQGNLWSWGIQKDMKVVYGNYDLVDEDGIVPAVGTDAYKKYMTAMAKAHPDQYPRKLKQIPEVNVDEISKHPNLAGITYSRQECQRCHVGIRGRERRGDYRGSGCSSCHVPYSNDGFYEGNDPTVDKMQRGHMLTHQMQATRKTKVHLGDKEYSGIPAETCVSCHNRGKRAGVSYQGLMEFPYGSPFNAQGGKQSKLHTKQYMFIKADLHHEVNSIEGNPKGGMYCQDCHTSIDIHGDGNIPGTTLAQVEIECEDCHGTVKKYPWELAIGRGEEFGEATAEEGRGLTKELPKFMMDGTVYEPEDGYLLTARGNPLGNVVKRGDEVWLHSATGLDFRVPVLKEIDKKASYKSTMAKVAMGNIAKHQETMECYACHADWAPQCYGCHVTMDYSKDKEGKPKMNADWISNANARDPKTGLTGDHPLGTSGIKSAGKASETRSYLRWETPTLGINGEGRVSPMMPGCQVITTVIDKDGVTVAENVINMTPEGKGLDHAAVQPHTAGRKARPCESCHDNPKALGYGFEGGRFTLGYEKGYTVDLAAGDGSILPGKTTVQIPAIPALDHDLSAIIDKDGKQLVSVGSHWPLTGPLPEKVRMSVDKAGVCQACHEERYNPEFWAKVTEEGTYDSDEHNDMVKAALEAYAAKRAMKMSK
ncbi:selenite/tellurite reduction operon c-type cytochrome ExtM [Magnetospira thiophila]